MLNWLNQNSQLLNVAINAGMLCVWLLYAQLLLSSYRRQRRPRVLINQIKGYDLDSELLLSNMSEEAIFIQGLLAVVEAEGDRVTTSVLTDVDIHNEHDRAGETRRVTTQGPLGAGSYMRLGSFQQLAGWVTPEASNISNWQVLEIRLIFLYGSEDDPIGVRRRFIVDTKDGVVNIAPESMDSERLTSRRQRKQVRQWLRQAI